MDLQIKDWKLEGASLLPAGKTLAELIASVL